VWGSDGLNGRMDGRMHAKAGQGIMPLQGKGRVDFLLIGVRNTHILLNPCCFITRAASLLYTYLCFVLEYFKFRFCLNKLERKNPKILL
jgi:hypothetical protein